MARPPTPFTIVAMTRAFVRSLGAVLLLLAPALAAASTDAADAEQLMRESALWHQLGSVAPSMRSGLIAALDKQGDKPSPAEMQRLTRAIETAYSADRLRPVARRTIAEEISAGHLHAIHAWYESPSGIAAAAAEVAAATDKRDPATVAREGLEMLARTPPPRRDLMRELMHATRAAEAAASIVINTALALQRGAAGVNPDLPGPSESELRDLLEAQRPRMEEAVAGPTLALYATMYEKLSEAELSAYVKFSRSEAGQHFSDVCIRALNAALADAGLRLGRTLAGPAADRGI